MMNRDELFCRKKPTRQRADIECVFVKGHEGACYMALAHSHPIPTLAAQPARDDVRNEALEEAAEEMYRVLDHIHFYDPSFFDMAVCRAMSRFEALKAAPPSSRDEWVSVDTEDVLLTACEHVGIMAEIAERLIGTLNVIGVKLFAPPPSAPADIAKKTQA